MAPPTNMAEVRQRMKQASGDPAWGDAMTDEQVLAEYNRIALPQDRFLPAAAQPGVPGVVPGAGYWPGVTGAIGAIDRQKQIETPGISGWMPDQRAFDPAKFYDAMIGAAAQGGQYQRLTRAQWVAYALAQGLPQRDAEALAQVVYQFAAQNGRGPNRTEFLGMSTALGVGNVPTLQREQGEQQMAFQKAQQQAYLAANPNTFVESLYGKYGAPQAGQAPPQSLQDYSLTVATSPKWRAATQNVEPFIAAQRPAAPGTRQFMVEPTDTSAFVDPNTGLPRVSAPEQTSYRDFMFGFDPTERQRFLSVAKAQGYGAPEDFMERFQRGLPTGGGASFVTRRRSRL